MRWICWGLLALALLSCNGSRKARVDPPSNPLGLEQELEEIRTRHGLPGLAAAVVRGGRVVSSAVAGVRRMSAGDRLRIDDRAYEKLHRTPTGVEQGFTLGWGVRRDERWGIQHYGAGSGGTFFVRIAIAPEHDAAVVVASNSGEAAAATKEVIESLLGSSP